MVDLLNVREEKIRGNEATMLLKTKGVKKK